MSTIDAASSYLNWSNTETVTLTPYLNGSAQTAVTGITALRRALSKTEIASGVGVYLQGDEVVWNLPNAMLSSNVPKPGDTITDAGSVVWTIISVQKLTWGTRWRCVCRQQR